MKKKRKQRFFFGYVFGEKLGGERERERERERDCPEKCSKFPKFISINI